MNDRRTVLRIGSWAALGCLFGGAAQAQSAYPNKAIRLVVPCPAASSTDVVARTISMKLGQRLNQTIIVDDKPGAGGNIAGKQVATSAPDGYTLFMGTVAQAVGVSYY